MFGGLSNFYLWEEIGVLWRLLVSAYDKWLLVLSIHLKSFLIIE